jgi:predicted dehydrogenase
MSDSHFSRRQLLGRAATFGAPAILAAQSGSGTLRVAVIGVGNRGSFLLRHIQDVPGVQVVAVSDLDQARLQKAIEAVAAKGGKAQGYTDFRKMLDERRDVDAVIIATPVDTHKMVSTTALEMGKSVYCEKPMAATEEETRMMVSAAKSAKGVFQVGFQLRHDPARRAAVEYIHSGKLGRVLYAQGYRHGGDLPRNTLWLFDAKRSGDSLVEQACHILDLFVWSIGKPPLRAMGSGGINLYKNVPPGRTTMDNYSLIYEFPDDVRVTFSHIYFDPPGFSGIKERVYCAEGAVDLAAGAWSGLQQKGANKLPIEHEGKDSTYLSLAAFVENTLGRKQPLNNADSGAQSTLTAILGRKAIYEKRIVEWKEVAG